MPMIVGKDESAKKRCTCKNCSSILEYLPMEVQERTYSCMGDPSGHTYVVCPACGKEVILRSW